MALVSVSVRIIDSVKHTFEKYYQYGNLAEDIRIAFIETQDTQHKRPVKVHAVVPMSIKIGSPFP